MTKASSTPKPTNKQPSMVCIGPYDNPNIEHKPNDAITANGKVLRAKNPSNPLKKENYF